MKIVIAPDSFKESLTALEVAQAIEQGFRQVFPQADYIKIPMADGGEGTVQSLMDALEGEWIETEVTDPLGNKIQSLFALSGDKTTAIIEMSAASGLALVPIERRNPLLTTSFGTGELIKAALNLGVKKILLGIGGSATNDGGAGMLQALGVNLVTKDNQAIPLGGEGLLSLALIDLNTLDPRLQSVQIEVICDVDNPLCGEHGAAAVFGPQKGASPEMVKKLDKALWHFAQIVQKDVGLDIMQQPGSGAAGGMGGGLLLLPQVQLKSGGQIVIETTQLASHLQNADLVITGEGRMDAQSVHGKTPIAVAKTAKQFNKPVIAIVGSVREDYEAVYKYGIDAVFPIIQQAEDLASLLQKGQTNLIATARNVARLYQLAKQ